MSKPVKNLVASELKSRFQGVDSAVLVSVAGMNANANHRLRMALRGEDIHLLVVKNSLARRATAGTPLAAAFEKTEGSLAVAWGGKDVVSLAKTILKLAGDAQYAPFTARGGVLDGAPLTPAQVAEVSKWPTRDEQLALLVGQILGPGARLAGQVRGPGGTLVSQIQERGKSAGAEQVPAADAAPMEPAPAG